MDISFENLTQENITVNFVTDYKWNKVCVDNPNETTIVVSDTKSREVTE